MNDTKPGKKKKKEEKTDGEETDKGGKKTEKEDGKEKEAEDKKKKRKIRLDMHLDQVGLGLRLELPNALHRPWFEPVSPGPIQSPH